ncbi:hypothetical protein QVD17_01189 [Tagetes erecta]|uniref:DOG1 domain-containing protein n=1 Tax=Tagetes erecta TaxID=13708 RepID=A0AAD8LA56_TARER|nr:hypothetical protein QVD17_01189 [Tagetes erecta]
MKQMKPTMAPNTLQTFTAFYSDWLHRHHHLQQQLSSTISQLHNTKHHQLEKLVQQASDHYRQYYQQKSSAIETDIFLICSPPWYTSFEQALFWVTEYPPSLLLRFVTDLNLTPDQLHRVECVKMESLKKERRIGDSMAMVQESVAALPLYGLVNRTGRLVDGEVSELDDVMEEAKETMRVVVMEADGLRGTVVMEVLKVLNVVQRVKFFAAVGEFRIRARRVGLQIDRDRGVMMME